MTRIIYHSADLDGHSSGAIANFYFNQIKHESCTMHPYNYGQDLPLEEWDKEDNLFFLDVSVQPEEKMIEIMKEWKVSIIDHHQTTQSLKEYAKGSNLQVGKAACELAWEFFFNTQIPEFISLLGRYDVWDNKDVYSWENRILPFQYGIKLYKTNPCYDENYYMWHEKFMQYLYSHDRVELNAWVKDIIRDGKTALKYARSINEMGAAYLCHDVEFEGLRFLSANTFIKNSQFFDGKYDPLIHDGMLAWTWNGKYNEYSVSIYTTKDIDLSLIAKKHGGGGHKQAAGFSCKHISFIDNKIIMEDK